MEEKYGVTQVNEDAPLQELEMSQETLGNFCGGGLDHSNTSAVCLPICFLVREQAKSLIAIKDLQKRLQHIEGVQGDVISAISDVHDYLTISGDSGSLRASTSPRSCASSKSLQGFEKSPQSDAVGGTHRPNIPNRCLSSPTLMGRKWEQQQQIKQKSVDAVLQEQALEPKFVGISRGKDTAPESDKQDSGLDSDCREHGQESNPSQCDGNGPYVVLPRTLPTRNSDELLDLLDEIGEKSEILRQHVSDMEESPNHCATLSDEMTKLHFEQLDLKNLLCSIKEERDDLKAKVLNLEHTTSELSVEKKDLEQRFISTLVEKHKLETKIQAIKPFSVRSSSSNTPTRTGGEVGLSNEAKLVYKVNSETVSSILKETSTVDLQKQVLTYMMENEILRAKIDQISQIITTKDMEKECLERVFRDEMRELIQENEQLRSGCDEQKMEIATLHSRVRMLEKLMHSMTAENQELHVQLAEFIHCRGKSQKGKYTTLSDFSDSGNHPRRFSLPARHANERDINVSCAKAKLLSNTSSFIDVTIDDKNSPERDSALNLEPYGYASRRSSTPLNPSRKHIKPNFSELTSFGTLADSNLGSCTAADRKPNKRLTFSSMKTLAAASNSCLSGKDHSRSRVANHSNSCDKNSRRNADSTVIRPLESIQETNPDDKTFPFYSILQKLKANPDYKLSNAVPSLEQEDEVASSGPATKVENARNGPFCKTVHGTNEPGSEESANQAKENRAGSKNIHRRIQNILDRITAESDAAATISSSMV